MLEERGKGEIRIHPGAVEVSSTQHDQRQGFVRRRDPSLAAVIGRCIVSPGRMIGHGSLIRSFGKNFRRDLLKICVETGVSSLRGEAAQLGQLLCSADGLNKLVKYLLGGGRRVGNPR